MLVLVLSPPARRPSTARERLAELERLAAPPETSDKAALQAELAYMRRLLARDRTAVSVTYPVNPPFAFVHVSFDRDAGEFRYAVREPSLKAGEEDLLPRLRERVEALTGADEVPSTASRDDPALAAFVRRKFEAVLDLFDIEIPESRRRVLLYYLHRDLVGLGRVDPVLRDPFIEDASCNGHGVPVFVFHRVFGSVRTDVAYPDETGLNRHIVRLAQIAGKHVSIYQPILDATLSDGSRVNLTLGTEVTRRGSTFSIRKFNPDPISPVDLLRSRTLDAATLAWTWELVQHKRSLLVSGGTASGKTTLLNALAAFIRPEDKVVSIEDTPEISLAHENWIPSVARGGYGVSGGQRTGGISLFDLLVAALRQRPEYVLVGEVRGKEAATLFQAIATGHAAMATIHAGSIDELLHRVENEPMNIPRVQFQALDAVLFPAQTQVGGQRVRRVRAVTEVLDVDPSTQNLITSDAFAWDPAADRVRAAGRSFVLERIAKATGRRLADVEAEVDRKRDYLLRLERAGTTHYGDVARAVNAYYMDPAGALAGVSP